MSNEFNNGDYPLHYDSMSLGELDDELSKQKIDREKIGEKLRKKNDHETSCDIMACDHDITLLGVYIKYRKQKENKMSDDKEKAFKDIQFFINNCFAYVSAIQAYPNWGDDFARKEAIKRLEKLQTTLKDKVEYDLTKLTEQQLKTIGFSRWSNELPIMLIPLHLFPALRDGTKLKCINGKEYVIGEDEIDLDIRYGCIGYGFEVRV